MKAVKISLAGRKCFLAFTGEAMFRIRDDYGGVAAILEAIKPDTREGLAVACKTAALLAEQGELARRHMGYDRGPIVDAETIETTITPGEIAALKTAIPAAFTLGFGRELADENEEVDVVLLELNQKKTT